MARKRPGDVLREIRWIAIGGLVGFWGGLANVSAPDGGGMSDWIRTIKELVTLQASKFAYEGVAGFTLAGMAAAWILHKFCR